MRWRARRFFGGLVVALALLSACGAERAAPVATRPWSPATTTAVPSTTDTEPSERTDAGPVESSVPESTTTTIGRITTTTTSTVAPPTVEAWTVFDEALASRLIGRGDYAASVAVAVRGEIVHTGAFGYRVPPATPVPEVGSVDSSIPVTTDVPVTTLAIAEPPDLLDKDDRFRIASISKVVTATVVLQLVEAGQLQLDSPIGEALAAHVGASIADGNVAAVTVRQLLAHTSGFPTYQRAFFGGSVDSCPAAAAQGLGGGLRAVPGTAYNYSNLNYCLLGLLVEMIAGRPYEDVVHDRLLHPLGIEGMRLAGTFDPHPAEVIHPSIPLRNYMEVLGAAGSWVATPSDVVTIMSALDPTTPGWHPLTAATLELMRAPAGPSTPMPGRGYGLGLMAFGDGSFGHTGTVENTHAMVVGRPGGMTWSVLVSGEYPGDSGNLRAIFDDALAAAGIVLS